MASMPILKSYAAALSTLCSSACHHLVASHLLESKQASLQLTRRMQKQILSTIDQSIRLIPIVNKAMDFIIAAGVFPLFKQPDL